MSDLISRQAVIDWLTNEWDGMVTSVFDGIKNLSSAQPEKVCIANVTLSEKTLKELVEKAKAEMVQSLPTVIEPERKMGKWIAKDLDNFRKYEVVCSECGSRYIGNYDAYDEPYDFNYCPNCGAKMEDEDE